jgi:F-type H+-transporting ATPase subunit delta
VFDLASAERKLAAWSEALAAAAAVVADAGAKRALANPALDDAARATLVGSIAGGIKGGELLAGSAGKNFLQLLAENGRLTAIPEIAAQFDALKAEAENTANVTVTSATPVDAALAEQIKKSLEKKLGRTVELTLAVDAA